MGINLLSISTLLLFLLIGLSVVDADIAMQKKAEVKSLVELANHHATFAIDQALKTEGIIDMVESEASARFDQRMLENGGYTKQDGAFLPAETSVTKDAISTASYYADFLEWRKDLHLSLRYKGDSLLIEKVDKGLEEHPTGGELQITVTTGEGEALKVPPKKMIGPSRIVVAYLDEPPLVPLLPGHAFPVVSVEELKW